MRKQTRRRDGRGRWCSSRLLFAAFLTWVFYPLGRTVWLGTQRSDPFGLRQEYVGLDQYREVLDSSQFHNSLKVTFAYVLISVPLAWSSGSASPCSPMHSCGACGSFGTVFSSTVASSVAVSALLWFVLLQPSVGVVNQFLKSIGREPVDFLNDPDPALFAVRQPRSGRTSESCSSLSLPGCRRCPKNCTKPPASTATAPGRGFAT